MLHSPTLCVVALGRRVAFGVLTVGDFSPCSPRPSLPAVHYVKPNHPEAVAGLTQDAVEVLQERDRRWQQYVELLEERLQGVANLTSFFSQED